MGIFKPDWIRRVSTVSKRNRDVATLWRLKHGDCLRNRWNIFSKTWYQNVDLYGLLQPTAWCLWEDFPCRGSSISRTPTHQYQGVNPTPLMSRFGTRNCRNHPWCTTWFVTECYFIAYTYITYYIQILYTYIYIISIDKHCYSIVFVCVDFLWCFS